MQAKTQNRHAEPRAIYFTPNVACLFLLFTYNAMIFSASIVVIVQCGSRPALTRAGIVVSQASGSLNVHGDRLTLREHATRTTKDLAADNKMSESCVYHQDGSS